jgi:hypothetical protein
MIKTISIVWVAGSENSATPDAQAIQALGLSHWSKTLNETWGIVFSEITQVRMPLSYNPHI